MFNLLPLPIVCLLIGSTDITPYLLKRWYTVIVLNRYLRNPMGVLLKFIY
jgi:hypothetical protein